MRSVRREMSVGGGGEEGEGEVQEEKENVGGIGERRRSTRTIMSIILVYYIAGHHFRSHNYMYIMFIMYTSGKTILELSPQCSSLCCHRMIRCPLILYSIHVPIITDDEVQSRVYIA